MTKVIMISRDAKVLDKDSAVYARVLEYSTLFDGLHIVVMSCTPKVCNATSVDKLFVYDATSRFKIVSPFKTFFKALKIARKNKSDNIWITSQDPFESGFLAFLVAKFTRIKLQLQFHTDCFNMLFIKHNLANFFRTFIARTIVSRADSIRVVSDRIRSSILNLKSKIKADIHLLPIWIDIEEIKNRAIISEYDLRAKFPEFSKIILIVARLESEKNIELGIRAFQKMLRFDKNLGLVIAGVGSKESWLKKLTNYLGISDRVKFLGWVPDVSSLYKTSDILLVTSFYEGYGLNMLESVACGTVVISTDVGVAGEIGANIVPFDAGAIALKAIEILNQNKKVELPQKFLISKKEYLELFKKTFIK